MHNKSAIVLALILPAALTGAIQSAQAQAGKASYSTMAPLSEYMISDENSEIVLARSAAPPSISGGAEVMVLGREGYRIAAKGTNGFMCLVERSWGAATDDAEFWNPKIRSPICFNPQAARTFAPIFLMKTRLVLAGKSKAEIVAATASALDKDKDDKNKDKDKKELPALEPGAMCYMMSKQQYLNDRGMSWHPHLMFLVSGDAGKSWGADLPGSPVIAADDPQERVTILMVWVANWSDGTTAPQMTASP